jgi:fluoride ion exporter CrcB/FEX
LFEDWPLGTLAANALASLLLALIAASAAAEDFTGADASTAGTGGGEGAAIGWRAKAALQGVGLGFCGCLSTVSTLANEVLALQAPRRRGADAYQCGCAGLSYPLATLVVCLAIGVAGYGWAVW